MRAIIVPHVIGFKVQVEYPPNEIPYPVIYRFRVAGWAPYSWSRVTSDGIVSITQFTIGSKFLREWLQIEWDDNTMFVKSELSGMEVIDDNGYLSDWQDEIDEILTEAGL